MCERTTARNANHVPHSETNLTGGFEMQTIWKRFHEAYSSRGCQVALLSLLTILLFAATANATSPKPIMVGQTTWYTAFPGGGALSGGNPAGVSWASNSKGVIVASETYGNALVQFSGP